MQALRSQKMALLVLILLTAYALTPGNTDRRLRYHEILVAQTATEMIERNDLVVPHIMGEVRLKKPPLSYWLSVAANRSLGNPESPKVSELEVRLAPLISGLLLVLVTFGIGLLVTRDPRGGLIAAAIVATSLAFSINSRSGRPEMLYALFCA